MKFPNWLKIIWWILLVILSGTILYIRLDAILNGTSTTFDLFIFLIFVAFLLVPIFAEIEFFGIKLKQEIEELKKDVIVKLGELSNEIRTSQVQTIHNTIQGFGPPPPDEKLPELDAEIEKIVKAKFQEHQTKSSQEFKKIDAPQHHLEMFVVRYNIEKELKRIWENRFEQNYPNFASKYQPLVKIITDLTKFEHLHENFSGILREILSICNYAIHGATLSENQIQFVENNAVGVIEYLRQLK